MNISRFIIVLTIFLSIILYPYQSHALPLNTSLSSSEILLAASNPNFVQNGQWSPILTIRDNTNTFLGNEKVSKPKKGWWVTPIHANLLPNGKVILTGWSRPKQRSCEDFEGRIFGTSFLLDPAQLDTTTDKILNITPIDEAPQLEGDVLYCSGHAPLPDGNILFMGGAKYINLGDVEYPPPFLQDEFGLNYARVFDGKKFSKVAYTNPGGPNPPGDGSWDDWYEKGMMWYPTITKIPGGKSLINGGMAKWISVLDPEKRNYQNRSVTIFDFSKFEKGQNPWTIWVNHDNSPMQVGIDVFDYPHSMLLPKPVKIDGYDRHVAIYGGISPEPEDSSFEPGLAFLSLDESVPEEKRFATPIEGRRPEGGSLNDTSSFITDEGHIVIVGGGNGGLQEGRRIDKFDPYQMKWTSLDTGTTRQRSASTILPDGTVLIINGEEFYKPEENIGDLTKPTIYYPKQNKLFHLSPWTDDNEMRGYHNISLLLKDGRVLIGGGRIYKDADQGEYRIGCERPELRIFSPPYLFQGSRPEIINLSDEKLVIGKSTIVVDFASAPIPEFEGVVLMALGSETHSFDQNQRRVITQYRKLAPGKLEIIAPESSFIAPEGIYNLFLISKQGVPSVAHTIEIISE